MSGNLSLSVLYFCPKAFPKTLSKLLLSIGVYTSCLNLLAGKFKDWKNSRSYPFVFNVINFLSSTSPHAPFVISGNIFIAISNIDLIKLS